MSEIAAQQPDIGPERPRRPSPLATLPAEWRESVSFFFAFHSDILKGTTGLVSRLRLWAKEHGLTLEDFRAVMRRLMQPARCAAFAYAGQLLAALAEEVESEIEARRRRERAAEDRQRFERAAHHAAPVGTIADATKGILGRWRKENASPPPKDGEA